MNETQDKLGVEMFKQQGESQALMERLIAVAQPGSVYSAPVVAGEYTVITASEVSVGMGYGYGGGAGSAPQSAEGATAGDERSQPSGLSYGGGAGGLSTGRPVAVISVGPNGVRVRPIVDVSKLALAWLTMIISIAAMFSRFRSAARRR